MFYITGDTHGKYQDLKDRIKRAHITAGDTLIILGDVGANFYLSPRDRRFKGEISGRGITYFCIHGNHEARPYETPCTYLEKEWNGGKVWYEEEYPDILFAQDGEIYTINGKKVFVCGGAYSVDKYYRGWKGLLWSPAMATPDESAVLESMASGVRVPAKAKEKADAIMERLPANLTAWWASEQPSKKIKEKCETVLAENNWKVDIVLTHTGPQRYEPREMFLSGINQSLVDNSTELWFNNIEEKLTYDKWYAGHYHTNKKVNEHFRFLFGDVEVFE